MPKLTVNEAASGFTHIVSVDYVDLIAQGTGVSKAIAVLPAGSVAQASFSTLVQPRLRLQSLSLVWMLMQ